MRVIGSITMVFVMVVTSPPIRPDAVTLRRTVVMIKLLRSKNPAQTTMNCVLIELAFAAQYYSSMPVRAEGQVSDSGEGQVPVFLYYGPTILLFSQVYSTAWRISTVLLLS